MTDPVPPANLTDLMRSRPAQVPVTTTLLAANVLVFVLMLFAGAGWWHTTNGVQLAWGANFGPATQDGQWWRLFTAMFVHFGVVHLSMNMFALWDVGRLVERIYGRRRTIVLFVGSGMAGNLVSLVVQGNAAVSAGASGAIFSLYGALLVFLWRERRQVHPAEFRWLFGGAVLFTILILGMGYVAPGIDNSAHGGGLLAGAVMARIVARPWTAGSPAAGGFGRWGAVLALVAALVWLGTHLAQPTYLYGDELRARQAIQNFRNADRGISQQWELLLRRAPAQGLTFEELAGTIEARVTEPYARSFEQLVAATPGSPVPSTGELGVLQAYAQQRVEASREVAEGFRTRDPQKIRQGLEQAKRARVATGRATSAAAPASAPALSK